MSEGSAVPLDRVSRRQAQGISRHVDVVVIGGGIVGLSSAWHLAQDGYDVVVIGAGHRGTGTTAAAGMLTPGCEWHGWMPRHFLDLLSSGRDYYPDFLAKLVDTPDRVGYRESDYLYLDLRERDEENAAAQLAALRDAGLDVTPLDLGQTARQEPGISLDTVRGSLLIRGDAVVDPRALLMALESAVASRGVLHVRDEVTQVSDDGQRFTVITSGGDRFSGEFLLLAAGAWTREVAGIVGHDLPVTPFRGQMIELSGKPGAVRSIVFMAAGACGSIVERYPGTYIMGTSEECTSGEPVTTPAVVTAILTRACAVVPAFASMAIAAMWAGFRPVAPDELPLLGTLGGGRIIVATGHYRNGILLGPLTGRIASDLVAGRRPDIDLSPYRPDRPFRAQYRFAARY